MHVAAPDCENYAVMCKVLLSQQPEDWDADLCACLLTGFESKSVRRALQNLQPVIVQKEIRAGPYKTRGLNVQNLIRNSNPPQIIPLNIKSNPQINQSQIGNSNTEYSNIFIVSGSTCCITLSLSLSINHHVTHLATLNQLP